MIRLKTWTLLTAAWMALSAAPGAGEETAAVVKLLDALDLRLRQLEQKQKKESDLPKVTAEVKTLGERMTQLSTARENDAKTQSAAQDSLFTVAADLREISGGLRTTLTATPRPVPAPAAAPSSAAASFTPELTGFLYYAYDGSEGAGHANTFDISRMYVGSKIKLDEKFSARVLADIGHEAKTGKFEVFTKYAYLHWDSPWEGAGARFGLQGTQNWNDAEKVWGYRVIRPAPLESFGGLWPALAATYSTGLKSEATALLDTAGGKTPTAEDRVLSKALAAEAINFTFASRNAFGSSADLGLAGFWSQNGSFLNVMVLNGPGYKKTEDDRFKNIQARAGKAFFGKALQLSLFGDMEPWQGKNGDGKIFRASNILLDIFAGVQMNGKGSLGLSAFSKTFATQRSPVKASGWSLFGNAPLLPQKAAAFARYDQYDPGLSTDDGARLLVAGVDYLPVKYVHLLPNVQYQWYEDADKTAALNFYVHLLVNN